VDIPWLPTAAESQKASFKVDMTCVTAALQDRLHDMQMLTLDRG
jgi:hypothetical protein